MPSNENTEANEKQPEVGNNPTDANFCPSCGEALPPRAVRTDRDTTLNLRRTTFECPSCEYSGEVIRNGGIHRAE